MASSKTRDNLVTEVLDNLGRLSTSTTRSGSTLSTRAIDWIDRALEWISYHPQGDILYKLQYTTLTQSVKSYSLPSNIRSIRVVKLEDTVNSRPIVVIPPEEFTRRVPYPENYATDRPRYMIPYYQLLTFDMFPIPNGAYRVVMLYTKWPDKLSTSTSTPEYTHLDQAIVEYATHLGFKFLGEHEEAALWLGYAKASRQEGLKAEQELLKAQTPRFVGFRGEETFDYWITDYHRNPLIMRDP